MPIRQECQFVTGWKDIAGYLGRAVRTVQRYEMAWQLPVRHSPGLRGAVFATKFDLDSWADAFPLRQPRTKPRQIQNVAAIREGIAEMHRLRSEMTKLRADVHESMRELHLTICSLRGQDQPQHTELFIRRAREAARQCVHSGADGGFLS